MKSIIEQDVCAGCAHLRPSQPLPTDKCVPPFGVFDIQCDCAKGWPYTMVFASANAIDRCPEFCEIKQMPSACEESQDNGRVIAHRTKHRTTLHAMRRSPVESSLASHGSLDTCDVRCRSGVRASDFESFFKRLAELTLAGALGQCAAYLRFSARREL